MAKTTLSLLVVSYYSFFSPFSTAFAAEVLHPDITFYRNKAETLVSASASSAGRIIDELSNALKNINSGIGPATKTETTKILEIIIITEASRCLFENGLWNLDPVKTYLPERMPTECHYHYTFFVSLALATHYYVANPRVVFDAGELERLVERELNYIVYHYSLQGKNISWLTMNFSQYIKNKVRWSDHLVPVLGAYDESTKSLKKYRNFGLFKERQQEWLKCINSRENELRYRPSGGGLINFDTAYHRDRREVTFPGCTDPDNTKNPFRTPSIYTFAFFPTATFGRSCWWRCDHDLYERNTIMKVPYAIEKISANLKGDIVVDGDYLTRKKVLTNDELFLKYAEEDFGCYSPRYTSSGTTGITKTTPRTDLPTIKVGPREGTKISAVKVQECVASKLKDPDRFGGAQSMVLAFPTLSFLEHTNGFLFTKDPKNKEELLLASENGIFYSPLLHARNVFIFGSMEHATRLVLKEDSQESLMAYIRAKAHEKNSFFDLKNYSYQDYYNKWM